MGFDKSVNNVEFLQSLRQVSKQAVPVLAHQSWVMLQLFGTCWAVLLRSVAQA